MSKESELNGRLEALEARVEKLEQALLSSTSSRSSGARTKKSSAREFLMTKQLKTDTQKVLALGFFLERVEGMESFNIKDLEKIFHAAKERPPKNINDAVNKNIARGFVMEAQQKKDSIKAWCLTNSGESYLETDLRR